MDYGNRQLTFNGRFSFNPSKQPNHRNSHSQQSPTFKTTIRSQSLPLKPAFQDSRMPISQSRKRRHRIFEDNKSTIQQTMSVEQRRQEGAIVNVKQRPYPNDEANIKSPFEFKELIEKKLAERASTATGEKVKEKMAMKERQIRFLKLQIERFRRCEILNKENEDLYKRLTAKLKLKAQQTSFQSVKQEAPQVRTPIHSLTEIRFTSTPPESKEEASKTIQNQPKSSIEALKTIPENQQSLTEVQNKNEVLVAVNSNELKPTPKSKQHRSTTRSPPRIPQVDREKDPLYQQMRQQITKFPSTGFKKDIYQAPLNVRLHEMNRNLESNINNHSRRPQSRPHSQSAHKSKRVDHSLYKSHLYVMMQ